MTYLILFPSFIDALCRKGHDLEKDELALALSAKKPDMKAVKLADVDAIETGKLSPLDLKRMDVDQTPGAFKLALEDLVIAAAGDVSAFQYLVVYNKSNSGLIGYTERTVAAMEKGDSVHVGFGGADGIFILKVSL